MLEPLKQWWSATQVKARSELKSRSPEKRQKNQSRNRESYRSPSQPFTLIGYGLIGVWALGGAIATGFELGFAQQLERQTQRWFYQIRGPVSPPDDIIILEIDQDSLQQGEFYWADPEQYAELEPLQNWPWQRTAYAQVIDRLMEAGARSVSVDVIFASPSLYGVEDDQRLANTIQRYGDRIVMAALYETALTNQGQTAQTIFSPPIPDLQVSPDQLGSINFLPDVDGSVYQFGNNYYEQALQHLELPEISTFADVTLQSASIDFAPPTNQEIFFYGPPGTFQRVSFWHVIDSTNWQVHQNQGTFDDKIVLIGATASALQDFVSTPFIPGETMPGVELHANAIATLLEDRAIAPLIPHPLGRGGVVLLSVLAIGAAISHGLKNPVKQLIASLLLAGSWSLAGYVAFVAGGWTMPVALPVMAIALCGLSILSTGVIKIQLDKLQLKQTLERYVAAPIVREILTQHSHDFQQLLKGRKVKAAILFSDIRGFTTLSLNLEPEVLIEQLNDYLNDMVEAILDVGGTVDKFIGDAIMAEFGSPISHGEKEDAMNAIRAALGMRRALATLQEEWERDGKVVFFNGVGINFGEAIAGDIGSLRRREYAVIGDAVNVASRVEGMTRKFWADILITESVYTLVADEIDAVDLGEHTLKGRGDRKVRLYSLVGLKGDDQTLYKQMLQRLRTHEANQAMRGSRSNSNVPKSITTSSKDK